MKVGDKVKVIRMDDAGGKDLQAARMNGVIGEIDYIDDAGQVHLKGYGLALIPSLDEFEIIND